MNETGSSLRINFVIPNATAPADLGLNTDKRIVGIAFSRMSIDSVITSKTINGVPVKAER
jgi:hypothetical protein